MIAVMKICIKSIQLIRVTEFLLVLFPALVASAATAPEYRIAVFREDVTVPLGHACMGGNCPRA